jgi:cellulose synthase/poly-beta-1,6-N-acetylglucosamine synthase-like glycosyltransferase/peptidoglycan/xylan/chitin deacetylase (PgdA/CDA1 family)
LRGNAQQVGTYPILSSRLTEEDTLKVLGRADVRARLVERIAGYVAASNDRGLAIPLSMFPAQGKLVASRFLNELARELRPAGRRMIVIVDDVADAVWLQNLARIADFILINCYNQPPDARERYSPIAAQWWIEARIAAARSMVPASQLIVGLGSFASDRSSGESSLISVQKAWDTMAAAGAQLTMDGSSLNSTFRYFDAGGLAHEVWMLDAASAFNQLRGALLNRPAAVALWRLGMEDSGVWASFARGKLPDNRVLSELTSVKPGPSPPTGAHEVLWSSARESPGTRQLVFSPGEGLITHEALTVVPSARKMVGLSLGDQSVIALTFDDGPHETVTPRILNILREKGTKATFFVVGRNVLQHPSVLKRIWDEGHDIGNHSYSHPDLSTLSFSDLAWQLNATQRALEAGLGIHTTLMRPPFAGAAEVGAGTPRVIEHAISLGYTIVLSAVDASDWLNPPPQLIAERIVSKVIAGRGRVIVLHDWGKREPTIAALPAIIDGLRARGYRFATIHEMLGLRRDEVMPPVVHGDVVAQTTADARSQVLLSLGWLGQALPVIALIGSTLCIGRLAFVAVGVALHRRRERSVRDHRYWPQSVAIIIPAYNEEAIICRTVGSVLQDHPGYEIIVVDDGSSDATANVVRSAFGHDPRVRVFKKDNGGKAAAANFALAVTDAEVIVAIDADTVLAADAIPLLVRHFHDERVGAVAGTALVGNQVNFLTRMQSLEYAIGQSLDRRAFSLYNGNGIVPGAIGAWRRAAIIKEGGYATDTLAEDADLTFRVIRAGWKVLYEPRAEARTEAPETWRTFLKQRYRWMFGMLQVIAKHGSEVRHASALGIMTIPNVIVFQFGFSILIPILDSLTMIQLGQVCWQWLHFDDSPRVPSAGLADYVRWWLFLQSLDLLAIAAALRLGGFKGPLRVVPLLFAQRFCYWPLIYWTALSTLLAAARGRAVGWNKLKRTGHVR